MSECSLDLDDIHSKAAMVCLTLQKFEIAAGHYFEQLHIRQRLREEGIGTADAMWGLAKALKESGSGFLAKHYFERALKLTKKLGSPEMCENMEDVHKASKEICGILEDNYQIVWKIHEDNHEHLEETCDVPRNFLEDL